MTHLTALYLRADNEDEMIAALPDYMHSTDETGTETWAIAGKAPRYDLCVIGSVVTSHAEIDPETGLETTPAVMDARFHVNILVDDTALADIPSEVIVDPAPATPAVKFAGVE